MKCGQGKPFTITSTNSKIGGVAIKSYEKGGLVTAPKKFDPEGGDYDYKTARAYKMMPDKQRHLGSVAPTSDDERMKNELPEDSYVVLKGKAHPTWNKGVEAEEARGSEVRKVGNRYYSVPKAK
jgi:hypothetical protein